MGLSHYDHKRASARLAAAFFALKWTVRGYHADESDAMTDYFDPAYWHGVAASPDGRTVFVCWKTDNKESGQTIEEKKTVYAPCTTCGGTGQMPGGWTLEQARANPQEYHRRRLVREYGQEAVDAGRVREGMAGVVSPIPFKDGIENCHDCKGAGQVYAGERVVSTWTYPVHQYNPVRAYWHIEHDGRIVKSGTFRREWCDHDKGAQTIVSEFVRVLLDDVAKAPPPPDPSVRRPIVRHNALRNGLEVVFPDKPDDQTRDSLKALGFRWSRTNGLWYTRYSMSVEETVRKMVAA